MMPTRAADRFFVDTNVVLYAVDPAEAAKRQAAQAWMDQLWRSGSGRLSWQVLNEFYVNAVRKTGVSRTRSREIVESLALWQPVGMSPGLVQRAWWWLERAGLSYWDALIVAAAERAECRWLLSEDFQTDRRFESVTIVNPFRASPDQFGLDLPAKL
jgi:predicted nucleic acid-binding protein